MKKILLISIVIISTVIACRKHYPEDNNYSLRSPFHRITDKTWQITKVELNGTDNTTTYKAMMLFNDTVRFASKRVRCDNWTSATYLYAIEGLMWKKPIGSVPYDCLVSMGSGLVWGFDKDKTSITMFDILLAPHDSVGVAPANGRALYDFRHSSFKIQKLTDKELTLQTTYKNNDTKIYFNKIR